MKETIFHAFNDFKARSREMKEEYYIQDRKMIRIGFEGKIVDLANVSELQTKLTSEHYETCHELGRAAYISSIDAYKSPSARSSGTCFPIFQAKAITNFDVKDSFVFNFKIIIPKSDPSKIRVEEQKIRTYDISEIKGLKL